MKKQILTTTILLLVISIFFSFDLPKGWSIAGSSPESYEMGTAVGEGKDGKNCATIKSKIKKIKGFGTLMQESEPTIYLGKRVKLSGYVKSMGVKDKAGLWFRIDGKERGKILGFDNMWNRPIVGTMNWTKCEIVLDVPNDAVAISYGALISGVGQIWFDEISLDIVDSTIATTNMIK